MLQHEAKHQVFHVIYNYAIYVGNYDDCCHNNWTMSYRRTSPQHRDRAGSIPQPSFIFKCKSADLLHFWGNIYATKLPKWMAMCFS